MPADELEPKPDVQPPRSGLTRRSRALLATGAGAALLIVVALATSGGFAISDDGSGDLIAPRLPSYAAWIIVPLLIVSVVVSFLVFINTFRGGRISAPQRTPMWVQLLTFVAVILGVVVLDRTGLLRRLRGAASNGQPAQPGARATIRPPGVEPLVHSTAFGFVLLAIAVALLVGFTLISLSVLKRKTRAAKVADPVTDALLGGLDAGIQDVESTSDPRAAVIRCYARMESMLSAVGLTRRSSEAPVEFLARVLEDRDVVAVSAQRLTALFERARYSTHAIDENMRAAALDALRGVRNQLGATA